MADPNLWYTTFREANRPGSPAAAMQPGRAYQRPMQQTGVFVTPNVEGGSEETVPATPFQRPNRYLAGLAQNMMAQGSSAAPVRSPLEGLARALTGVAGGYFAGQAREQEDAFRDAKSARLAELLGMSPEEAQGLSSEEMIAVKGVMTPKAVETWSPMSAKAAADRGLPEGVYQVSSKGKIQPISKGGIEVNVDTGETYDDKAAEEAAKYDQGYRDQLRTAADDARSQRIILNRASDLLESGKFETGALGPAKLAIGQLLTAFGLPAEEFGLGDVATGEQLEAVFNKGVMGVLNQYRGALSEGERAFAISQEGNISRTPEANRALLDIAKNAAQRKIEQYSMLRKWNRAYGSPGAVNEDGLDFEDMWEAYVEAQGEGFRPPEIPETSPEVMVGNNGGGFGTMSRQQLESVPMSEIEGWSKERQAAYAKALREAQANERPGT